MRGKGFTLIELLIVVAIIAILAAIAVPNFLEAQVRSKVSRVKNDQRAYATALESYYIDNNNYPAVDNSTAANEAAPFGHGVNALPNASTFLRNMPTFRRKRNQADPLSTLTTPVSYLSSMLSDTFAKTAGAIFSYSTADVTLGRAAVKAGWIIWSFGPDLDETTAQSTGAQYGGNIGVSNAGAEGTRVETAYYNPLGQVPSPTLIAITYDATNGTTSRGDIYRVKQ